MEKKEIIEEVKWYFADSDHWRRLCSALQDPDPTGCHIHSYVETSVHPDSLENLMKEYFARMGWPSVRKIDHMAPKKGMGSLHGVEPKGKPHFDYQWFFNSEAGLRPIESGESGCNLLVWNRWYINQFCRQFPFSEVGSKEGKKLEDYFKSGHFLKGLEFPVMPTTNHMHINVRTSVHPDIIQKFAEAALYRENIRIDYTCPNVYMADGKNYRGKLVFMSRRPEVVFDIGWLFDPEVVIEPAYETWIFEENPGYDVWSQSMLDEVMDNDYVKLSDSAIQEVLSACQFPE
ncbi:MAG: hypothetical protein K9K64_02235 [Desulfohalobiaceae bacterium]|nr:hypothetical protein [Desulfohalobiaceae bacterium]MCF8104278.1 hypothetical protein [Desulfohalobiaceae bacterium]